MRTLLYAAGFSALIMIEGRELTAQKRGTASQADSSDQDEWFAPHPETSIQLRAVDKGQDPPLFLPMSSCEQSRNETVLYC